MRSAIVLGGGMVGVTSALHLQRRGWSVALIDRKEPGRETSYGNAGIIQSEAVEPYAMPRDMVSLGKVATGRTNDVRYHVRWLPHHVGPLLRYWWHSAPDRHRKISLAYARIIAHAASEHDVLIHEAGANALVRRAGYRLLHRQQAALDKAAATAEARRLDHGVNFRVMSRADLAKAEPIRTDDVAGAIYWLDPWTVSDPGGLVSAYADLFRHLGGTVLQGDARSLAQTTSGWSVDTTGGLIDAETAVVALGPWSPDLLRRFGYHFPLVRKRGYHRHYRGGSSLNLPLIDNAFGYVIAPMADGLRITTGAELTGPDAPSTPVQLARAEIAARQLLDLGHGVEAAPWHGTRPCTPDMLPVLGQASRHRGLWINFGHGHQGFTLGPVSGRLLTEMIGGEAPLIDPSPYRPDRF